MNNSEIKYGYLASRIGIYLPLLVIGSDEGFYIGTWQNGPITRESKEYFSNGKSAQQALNSNNWTQFEYP